MAGEKYVPNPQIPDTEEGRIRYLADELDKIHRWISLAVDGEAIPCCFEDPPNDGYSYGWRDGGWVRLSVQQQSNRFLEPFLVTDLTVGQSPITSNNLGFQDNIPPGDTYGTVSPQQTIASKGSWYLYRVSKYDQPGEVWDIGIGFIPPGSTSQLPDTNDSWSYFEIENKAGDPSFHVVYYRTDFTVTGTETGDPRGWGTYWTYDNTDDLTWTLNETYDVRFFDWSIENFTLGGAQSGTLYGYRSGSFGTLTPGTTNNGYVIHGIWGDTNTSEFIVAIEDEFQVHNQYLFGSIYMEDAAGNEFPPNSVSTKTSDATFSHELIDGNMCAKWVWTVGGIANLNDTLDVVIAGFEQP